MFGILIATWFGMTKASVDIGRTGEDIAAQYLTNKGYLIIERNFRSQQGEVDIIARDGEFLVFIEVKNYSFRSIGTPLGAVRKSKRESIIHAARTYLFKNKIKGINCRFDVLSIYNMSQFQLIKDAFHVN